jgi:hypothetical protein
MPLNPLKLIAPLFISTVFTSERLAFFPTYLYQKDERALPGDLRRYKFSFVFTLNVVFHTPLPSHTHTHTLSSLSS